MTITTCTRVLHTRIPKHQVRQQSFFHRDFFHSFQYQIKSLLKILAKIFLSEKNLRTSPSHEIRSTTLGSEGDKFAKDENNGCYA